MPNYTNYNIPDFSGLLSFLPEDTQGLFGLSGGEIASHFGYDPDKYGEYFQEFNPSSIKDTLNKLPEMQSFMYGQNRQGYSNALDAINNKMGQTGLASTGSFSSDFSGAKSEFSNSMFGADKELQEIVGRLREQISNASSGWYDTLGTLRQFGARKIDDPAPSKQWIRGDVGEFFTETLPDSAGTVLCTELHRQGIMSDNLYQKDIVASKQLPENMLKGYRILAAPIVKKMQRSKRFTRLITPLIMSFSKHLAGEKNIIGGITLTIGRVICPIVYNISKNKQRRLKCQHKALLTS